MNNSVSYIYYHGKARQLNQKPACEKPVFLSSNQFSGVIA